jgi:hypothetical protein
MENIQCANCKNDAYYTIADPGINSVSYCNKCLPKHLLQRANRGDFKIKEKKKESKAKAEE